jgi:hypothetical protein
MLIVDRAFWLCITHHSKAYKLARLRLPVVLDRNREPQEAEEEGQKSTSK